MAKIISRRALLLLILNIVITGLIFLGVGYVKTVNVMNHVFVVFSIFLTMCYVLGFFIFDYYSPFRRFKWSELLSISFFVVVVAGLIAKALSWRFPHVQIYTHEIVFISLIVYMAFVLLRKSYEYIFCQRKHMLKTLVIGDGAWLDEILFYLHKTDMLGLEIVGVVFSHQEEAQKNRSLVNVLGDFEHITRIVREYHIDVVVLAMEEKTREKENNIIARLYQQDVKILSSLNLYEQLTGMVPFHFFRGGQLLLIAEQLSDNMYMGFKRVLDIIGSVFIGIMLFPFVLIAIILLMVEFRSLKKVFFIQDRVGLHGKKFKMFKLRTMMDTQDGQKIITFIGRWVRKYRLDEAPQILNILIGDMSLIGPRPEMSEFVAYCQENIPFYNVILSIKPGLTGWAQVKFAHTTKKEDYKIKFCYDLYYLQRCSLLMDGIVFFETMKTILFGRGK